MNCQKVHFCIFVSHMSGKMYINSYESWLCLDWVFTLFFKYGCSSMTRLSQHVSTVVQGGQTDLSTNIHLFFWNIYLTHWILWFGKYALLLCICLIFFCIDINPLIKSFFINQRLPSFKNWRTFNTGVTEENKKKNRTSSVIPCELNTLFKCNNMWSRPVTCAYAHVWRPQMTTTEYCWNSKKKTAMRAIPMTITICPQTMTSRIAPSTSMPPS